MEWKKIKGFEDYELSIDGSIRKKQRSGGYKNIKANTASNGDLYVQLYSDRGRSSYMLHKLYAATFRISVKDARSILYEKLPPDLASRQAMRLWVIERIEACLDNGSDRFSHRNEVLYLLNILKQLNFDSDPAASLEEPKLT